jgi:hypothetical protein
MTKKRDFGILWVVVVAAIFWVSVWQHEVIVAWMHKVWVSSR